MPEVALFLLMVAVFVLLAVALRIPLGVSLALSALAGLVAAGEGFGLRHLVEGAFGFFDIIMIIASAMIFMKVLQESGVLDSFVALILRAFHRRKTLLLLTLMLLLMFPGMITGSSLASVLSTGALAAPVLIKLGLPKLKTAAFIAMGAVLGMIAPPVNIPVMIMGAGVDMPYVGLTLPLLVIVIPAALFSALWIGRKDVHSVGPEEMRTLLPINLPARQGIVLYAPLLVVVVLMIFQNVHLESVPDPGIPGVFILGSLVGIFSGRRFNFFRATQKAVEEAIPILSILAGVGMFIQVMSLTGVRGWAVVKFLSLPTGLLYLGIALSMPLFGGVSAFGSASILGVPFMLAMINKNALITASALSAIVSVGDLIPPAAMSARFSAQVVAEEKFSRVLRYCLVPAAALLVLGLCFLLFSGWLDKFM